MEISKFELRERQRVERVVVDSRLLQFRDERSLVEVAFEGRVELCMKTAIRCTLLYLV